MTVAQLRTIDRGANPFAPIAKQRNQALTTPRNGVYERLEDRVATMLSDTQVNEQIATAVESLRQRLEGKVYQQHHLRVHYKVQQVGHNM